MQSSSLLHVTSCRTYDTAPPMQKAILLFLSSFFSILFTVRHPFFALLLLLTLTNCGSAPTKEETHQVRGAASAVLWTERLLHAGLQALPTRPSALMGVYMGMYLSPSKVAVVAAMRGVESMKNAIEHLGIDSDYADVFELLTQFGSALQIDVPDMLNRNAFRAEALEQYSNALRELMAKATGEQERLEREEEQAADERKERRKEVSSLEKEARTAQREKNYSRVGEVQQSLVSAKASEAEAEAKEEQISALLKAIEDMLDIAEERITAIDQNREILIAGLRVIKVPGIEDLKILDEKRRKSFSFGKSK